MSVQNVESNSAMPSDSFMTADSRISREMRNTVIRFRNGPSEERKQRPKQDLDEEEYGLEA